MAYVQTFRHLKIKSQKYTYFCLLMHISFRFFFLGGMKFQAISALQNYNIPFISQTLSLQASQSFGVDLLMRSISSSVKPAHFSADIILRCKIECVIIRINA